jgi:hypothetical protein
LKPIVRTIGALLFWAGLALTWLSGCRPAAPSRETVKATVAVASAAAGKGSGRARVSRPAKGGGVETWDLEWFNEWMEGQRVNVDVQAEVRRGLSPLQKAAMAGGLAAVAAGVGSVLIMRWRARRALLRAIS